MSGFFILIKLPKEGANKPTKPVFFIEHLENRPAIHTRYSPRIAGFYPHVEARGFFAPSLVMHCAFF